MNIKNIFNKNKPAMIGGFIGLGICIALFIVYIILFSTYYRDKELGPKTLLVPLITGHMEVFGAGFYFSEGTTISKKVCKQITTCTSWTAANLGDCRQYTLPTGENGCCQEFAQYSEPSCTEKIGLVALVIAALLLCAVYFGLGYFITKKLSTMEVYE